MQLERCFFRQSVITTSSKNALNSSCPKRIFLLLRCIKKKKDNFFSMRKKFAICSSENLLKNCAINFYSYSSFWKQQKHFRVVKFSKMLPTFYKTTAKKIHSIFNLESFFDFFGDASQKSYQKRYMLIWKNILLIKKLSKRMKKKYYEHYAFAFSFPYITTTTQQHIVLLWCQV